MELKLTATETAAIRKAVNGQIYFWLDKQQNGGPFDPKTVEFWLATYNGILAKLETARKQKRGFK